MSLKKKILLIIGSIITLVVLVIIGVYFWAIQHASTLLTKLVDEQSKGKLALTIKKVEYSFFNHRMVFIQPDLTTKDSTILKTGYHVNAKNITLKLQSFAFTFIFQKQLNVDSIIVNSPEISVFKYKYTEGPKQKISLPEEFAKVYQSLDLVLQKINLNYLHFDSSKFTIYDLTKPGVEPLQVSNLNLTIDGASSTGKNATDNRFLFADRILVEVFNQDIQFKDGLQGIKFKRLRLSTGSKTLKLDNCTLYGRKTDSTYGGLNISFESINISNIDFNKLTQNNILKVDSALCINPHIMLQLALNNKKATPGLIKKVPATKDSVELIFKKLLGDLDIGYLAVINASINIESKKEGKISSYTADKIDFGIKGLVVIDDPAIPLHLSQLDIAVRNYTSYKLDSLTTVKFDSIKLIDNKIKLSNFSLSTTKENRQLINSTIKARSFELSGINWQQLIYEQKLSAGTVSLVNPEVNIILPNKKLKGANEIKTKPSLIPAAIKERLQLNKFFIVDGMVNIKTGNGIILNAAHCFADIKVNQFLKANSLQENIDAVSNLSFSSASFINPRMKVLAKEGSYSSVNKSLKLKEVKHTKNDNSIAIDFKNLEVTGINVGEGNNYSVSNLSWGNANIIVNKNQNDKKKSVTDTTFKYKVVVSNTSGAPAHISFNGPNISASTQMNKLSVGEIILQTGEKPIINAFQIDGQSILVNQNKTEIGLGGFTIGDKNTSIIKNITLRLPAKEKTIKIFLPELIFSTDINKGINGLITADLIELNKPVISFESGKGVFTDKPEEAKHKLPLIQIGTVKINEPLIGNLPDNLADKMQLATGVSMFTMKGINSDGEAIRVDSLMAGLKKPRFSNSKLSFVPTGKELIQLGVIDFTFSPWADSIKEKWSFTINTLHSSDFLINIKKSDTVKQAITLKSLNLQKMALGSISIKNYKDLINNNRNLLLTNADVVIDNGKTIIEVNNLQVDRSKNRLSLDSFYFSPILDRDSFMKTKPFQATYIKLKTGNILVSDIDFAQMVNDTSFVTKKVNLTGGNFDLYSDKRLPFNHVEKPMLTQLLQKLKLKIAIDSLVFRNTQMLYEEMNERTPFLSKVTFKEMRGNVAGVRNFNYSPTDSLRFTVATRIMDSARVKVKYAQSYTDSLSAFILQLNIRPFNLPDINPMIVPLLSARVNSGYLDTLSMIAIGRKYIALGKMKMYYHGLDFQYLDKGSEIKKTFKTKLISFLGNLLTHKNNSSGTGKIYSERNPEKGFANYWIRILLSGTLTNTGIRSNKKQEKKYREGIKKFDVPPITEISIE